MTCHVAVEDPAFRDGAEPLRQHSPLVKSHPPERFGCAACHDGEGRALTTLEAHGYGGIRARPLLRGEYLQAACFRCHGERTLPAADVAAVARGRALVNRMLCLGCHPLDGKGGEEGPDLGGVGARRSWLWLYAHLVSPQAAAVGSTMPVFAFGRDEIRDVTIYLMTLRNRRDPWRVEADAAGHAPPRPVAGRAGATSSGGAAATIGPVHDGEALFDGLGCRFCHRIGNRGGEVGPTLTFIGRRRGRDELRRLLRDPEEVFPGGKMPQLHLREPEIAALVAFLAEQQ
jgi:cytochrome c2